MPSAERHRARRASDRIEITPRVSIPIGELDFVTSRSSGPGGQNVNKVETRVTLLFDVANSPSLSTQQKKRVRATLPTRISKAGVLRVVSQKHRSQSANRKTAIERYQKLMREALVQRKQRRPSKVPKKSKQRRLETKRRRGEVKRARARVDSGD